MKISYFILFLVILSTWRMHFVGDENLSSQHLPVLPGRKHDTVLIASLDGTIHLVEGNSWKVRWSFSSGPALCSSYQTLRWGKDDTKSLINGDYSIECGDDWNLYVRKRTLDKVEPTGTVSKYVNSSPHYLKGMIVLGHREVIIFKVDARTGRVKSVVTDANEQYLIKKDVGESTNMPANELLITRTNYMLHSYFRDTLEPAWNMTVGYIKFTHHCLNFGKTYSGDDMAFPCGAKGVVHRSHEHNPLHFAVKSLDSRNEDEVIFLLPQHLSSSTLNMSPDQLEKGANDYNLKFLGGSSFLIIGLLSMLRKIIAGLLGYQWQKSHVQPNRQPSGLNEKREGKKRNSGSTIQGNLQLEDNGEFPVLSLERDAKNGNNGSTIKGHLQLEDEEEFPALSPARVAKNENNGSTIQGHLQLEGEKEFPALLLERDAKNENNGSTIQGHLQLEDEEELPFLSLNTECIWFSSHLLKELEHGKMLIQGIFNLCRGGVHDEEEFEKLLLRGYKRRHPEFLTRDCNEGNGCFIGKIFVSKREIARGRNRTIIFEGIYSNKVHVAVKRVVYRRSPMNYYYLGRLIDLVQHPNIVHVIDIGMDDIFYYFALERCDFNLYELIQLCNLNRGNACDNSITQIDKMLWQPNGYLSPVSVKLIRKHDTVLIASLDGTIHLVEGNSWKVRWSFSSGPALCSSYQTLRWGKDDTKSLINGDYSIECGDDWNLYVRKRTLDKVEPTGTVSKYVNSSPHYLKGMIVLGHREVIIFKVDARTGRVKSAVTDANEQYLIKKDVGESTNMPANELLITRTNYMLHSYFRDTLEPAWNMTVGYIKFTHHCLNFGKTYSGDDMAFPCGAKGVVHRSHEHNPLHFAVKSLDSRNEDEVIFLLPQHLSSSTLNMSPDQLEKGANDYNLKFLGGSSFLIIGLLSMLRKIIAGLLGYQWQKSHVQPNRQPSGLNEKREGKKRNSGSTIQGNLQLEDNGEFPALLLERDAKNGNNGSTIQGHLQLEDEEELPFLSLNTECICFSGHLLKELKQGKMLIQGIFNLCRGGVHDEEEFEKLLLRGYKRRHPEFLTKDCNEGNGCFIGKIFVSKREIARGRNRTIIFEGIYSNKVHVAVKRVVYRRSPVNYYFLGRLIDLVQHPNIVHVIDIGMDDIFYYFALERCDFNLYELIRLCNLNRGNACDNSITQIDKMLWQPNGYLSPVSVKLIRDVVSGLEHLHNQRFQNRDLKPQRVLINLGAFPHAKICDQGIIEGRVAHHRSPGWHSPKTPLGGPPLCRRTGLMLSSPAPDLFNLGCLIFYFITKGHHPFGLVRMRDTNIKRNCPDLALVKHHYEAAHLISNLLHPQPEMRPAASKVLYHPFFWDSERRGYFLHDVSDWLVHDESYMNGVFNEMMDAAPKVLGGNWDVKMEALLLTYSTCQACYRYDNFLHLLLFIGNTLSAQQLLPKDIQELIGSTHGEIYDYFASQFPKLLIVVYDVLSNYCEENIDLILDNSSKKLAVLEYFGL